MHHIVSHLSARQLIRHLEEDEHVAVPLLSKLYAAAELLEDPSVEISALNATQLQATLSRQGRSKQGDLEEERDPFHVPSSQLPHVHGHARDHDASRRRSVSADITEGALPSQPADSAQGVSLGRDAGLPLGMWVV